LELLFAYCAWFAVELGLPQQGKIIQPGVGTIGGRAQAPTLGDESEIESALKGLKRWAAAMQPFQG
jgi:hypothetical protein